MTQKIVVGATGLLGSAFMRRYPDALGFSSKDFDVANTLEVADWFTDNEKLFEEETDVYLCMGRVAGIKGQNNLPMLVDNAYMALNMLLFLNSYLKKGRVIYFSSSCVYPRAIKHKLEPSDLLGGHLEQSNEGYALAKIVGTKFIEYMNDDRFYTVVPPNLCGPNDNWNLDTAHVLQSMIRKIHMAKDSGVKELVFWGSPDTKREYLYVDDLVRGVECFLNITRSEDYEQVPKTVHIGYGSDFSLSMLANMIASYIGYAGTISFNGEHKGIPQKLLNSSYMTYELNWKPKVSIISIIEKMIEHYAEYEHDRERT